MIVDYQVTADIVIVLVSERYVSDPLLLKKVNFFFYIYNCRRRIGENCWLQN